MKMLSSTRRFTSVFLLSTLITVSAGAPLVGRTVSAQSSSVCGSTLCFRPAQFYLANYKRLRFFPRDIFISGVNFNHPVDCVAQPLPILFALRGNSSGYGLSPLQQFNQQYVAVQLAQALIPLFTAVSASKSGLSCYKLDFEPVKLSGGVVITPDTTLAALFTQCDITGIQPVSEERDADMFALARVLSMLNSACQ